MSFGYSVGDLVTVANLAWSVYKSCKGAPESFKHITTEVIALHAVLQETNECLSAHPLAPSKQASFGAIIQGCQEVLGDLQTLLNKYKSLGTQSKRTWDRMGWGMNNIGELRARITSNTSLLTAYLIVSQVAVEQKLDDFLQEVRNGWREGSVVSVQTIDSLSKDERESWRMIRKELEDIGITVAAFEANKDFIIDWFVKAVATGAFTEAPPTDGREIVARSNTLSHSIEVAPVVELEITPPSSLPSPNDNLSQSCAVEFISNCITEPPNTRTISSEAFDISSPESSSHSTESDLPTRANESNVNLVRELPDTYAVPENRIAGLDLCQSDSKLADGNMTRKQPERKLQSRPCLSRSLSKTSGFLPFEKALISAVEANNLEIVDIVLNDKLNSVWIDSAIKSRAFLSACQDNQIQMASLLIEHGVDHETRNHACVKAIDRYDVAMARFLIQEGADPTKLCPALSTAVAHENEVMVRLLIERGVDLATKNEALRRACQVDNKKMAAFCIDHGADVNSKDAIDQSPLHEALCRPSLSCVNLLINHGAVVDASDTYTRTAMTTALMKGGGTRKNFRKYIFIILALVKAGVDVNYELKSGETALSIACRLGSVEDVKELLNRGANANIRMENGLSLLHITARQTNSLKMSELLLNAGADVDALTPPGDVRLQDGLRSGNIGVCVPVLISRVWMGSATGPPYRLDDLGPPEQYERIYWNRWYPVSEDSPLHLAVFHENIEQVKLLLDAGADVNIRGIKSSLYWPVDRGSPKTTRTWLNFEFAPICIAVIQGNIKLVELLLNAGADVNVHSVQNRTPLHMTVAHCIDHFRKKEVHRYQIHTQLTNANDVKMVRFLLDAGANVNDSDTEGWSSLHWAAYHGLPNVAQILLPAGADVNAQTLLGETPLSLAYTENVRNLLLKYGANPTKGTA